MLAIKHGCPTGGNLQSLGTIQVLINYKTAKMAVFYKKSINDAIMKASMMQSYS